ncbi:SDR family NAD(P)-dependent oxidoreductase [Henriciella litoralis]|uniref:SDR family NAD(P)-dependent oxidoreductase n=1 Tax=Henriciella litoralis TaxID=568102 RepID=UPI000A0157AB|nr:SDR family NAD(P)-dependent oxidoreductase [Henriciella litoralis]
MQIGNKNALVTGATGGIGRATALMLAREGVAKLVISDIDRKQLEPLAKEIRTLGAEPIIIPANLSSPDEAIKLYEQAETKAGGLDIIHNNAGIMGAVPDFPDAELSRMVAALQINFVAMVIGTRIAIGNLRKRGVGGVIINTSSVAAFEPMPADPAYSSSKAAILSFSRACEPLKDSLGIRVVPLCPAVTDTAIVPKDAPWLADLLKSIKLLQPDDIAAEVKRIIEDDTIAGEPVVVENEPA